VSVAHRIGRDALLAELDKIGRPEEPRGEREAVAGDILATPVGEAEEYFALFYRGLIPDDLARTFLGRIEN